MRSIPATRRDHLAVVVAVTIILVVLVTPIGRGPIWEPNNARWVLLTCPR